MITLEFYNNACQPGKSSLEMDILLPLWLLSNSLYRTVYQLVWSVMFHAIKTLKSQVFSSVISAMHDFLFLSLSSTVQYCETSH